MTMPETAMYKDCCLPFGKDNIRLTGQLFHMEPETEASRMKRFPYGKFRFRVLTTNPAHVPRTPFRVELICHFSSLISQRSLPRQQKIIPCNSFILKIPARLAGDAAKAETN
jgi:hypothetical protein